LLQAFSAVDAEERPGARLRSAAANASRFMGFAAFGLGGAMLATSPQLMAAWLNRSYPGLDRAVVLLVLLQLVNASRYNCAIVIVALGRAGIGARAKLFALIANVVLTVALVVPFGLTGVLVGTIVASGIQSAFMLRRYFALLEGAAVELLWSWYLRVALVCLVSAGFVRAVLSFAPSSTTAHRGPALVALVVGVALYGALFSVGVRLVGYLSTADLTYLGRILPGPLGSLTSRAPMRWLARSRP
jgi:O-antigen/teichoic acid export membrane protein